MSSTVDKDQNYFKLAQLKNRISSDISLSEVRAFLKSGYQVNYALPFDGCTVLHLATLVRTARVRTSILNLLLKKGADFTLQNFNNFSPLRLAFETYKTCKVYGQCKSLCNLLLTAHIKFKNATNPRCNNGISHLHIACFVDNFEVVQYFLEAGEPVNEAISASSDFYPGYTCLHFAVVNEDIKLIQLLLEHGADRNCLNAEGKSPLHLLVEKQIEDVSCMKKLRDKILLSNELIMAELLQPSENDVNPSDCIGLTHFHVHCTKNQRVQTEDWNKFLGVDINISINVDSPIWAAYTPLHFAALCNFETTLILLQNGANLLAEDVRAVTPFDLCLQKFAPSAISNILKTRETLGSIKFVNGENLVDVLPVFDSESQLQDYLSTADVNNTITVDSPLWPGFTVLHVAVMLSHVTFMAAVPLCLRKGADITIPDANNMTALHIAFYTKRRKCIIDILEYHLNVPKNPTDDHNLSHFHIACTVHDIRVPKMFLDNGMDPNGCSTEGEGLKCIMVLNNNDVLPANSTPLHIAAAIESRVLAQLLLDGNADPHLPDAEGFTYVHRVFVNGNIDKCTPSVWLPDTFPKVNLTAPGAVSYLHIACYCSFSTDLIQALLANAADVNQPINGEIMRYVKKLPEYISIGDTPLHMAVRACSEALVNFLLQSGAHTGLRNEKGLTPLHLALQLSNSYAIIKRLALDVDATGKWVDFKLNRFHVACALKDEVIIKKLLQLGEDPLNPIARDSPIWPGQTPLGILMGKKYPENDTTVKLLLMNILKKIEISRLVEENELHALPKRQKLTAASSQQLAINQDGLTAFHVSCMGSDPNIVWKFMDLGADVNGRKDCFATSDAGYTPLHFSVMYGTESIIEILLRRGADVSLYDMYGRTPIQLAVFNRPERITLILRLSNTDVGGKNVFGQTIVDMFLKRNSIPNNYLLELLKRGAAKYIDYPTRVRLVTLLIQNLSGQTLEMFLQSIPKLATVDGQSRNVIHHLFMANNNYEMKHNALSRNIELLLIHGCDIEHQDKHGRTPLHYSVLTYHQDKIQDLLSIGVDINVVDVQGETPYTYCFKNTNLNIATKTYDLFHDYISKIQAAGLYLHPLNEACSKQYMTVSKTSYYSKLLEKMDVEISPSLSIRYLLTEEMVMRSTVMHVDQNQLVLNYLQYDVLHQMFPDLSPLFKLQHRKVLNRAKNYSTASRALLALLDPRLPGTCLKSILVHLTNEDWNNLIRSQRKVIKVKQEKN